MVERKISPRWVAVVASGVLVLTACSSGSAKQATPAAQKKADPNAAQITITPGDGGAKARPDRGVDVRVTNGGSIERISVLGKGNRRVVGAFSTDRTAWSSRWTLNPGEAYTVNVTAKRRDGKTQQATSKFTTLKPTQRFGITSVVPSSGTVGVGMPIIVNFDRPIFNREQVERALEIKSSKRIVGAWRWVGNQQVIFRTRKYWPAGTQVSLVAHTSGVRGAKGVYGAADRTVNFAVGDSHISTVDVKSHKMSVQRNGETVKSVGISAGKGGERKFTTTNGVHLTMDKGNPVIMTSEWQGITDKKDPDYYKLKVKHAVRISNSGEYVHAAPWSVAQQGRANVSHGCVNASPDFAEWFYNLAQPGDVVVITGTNRELEVDNGWGYWQMPFTQWVANSALKRPVDTAQRAPRPKSANPSGVPSVPADAARQPSKDALENYPPR